MSWIEQLVQAIHVEDAPEGWMHAGEISKVLGKTEAQVLRIMRRLNAQEKMFLSTDSAGRKVARLHFNISE